MFHSIEKCVRKEVSCMQNLIAVFGAFWDKYMFWINRPNVTVTDIVEIIIEQNSMVVLSTLL